ncbi:MAG: hypothetical protein WCG85_04985 [Polyangia bacterium]
MRVLSNHLVLAADADPQSGAGGVESTLGAATTIPGFASVTSASLSLSMPTCLHHRH